MVFEIIHTFGRARTGYMKTFNSNKIEMPVFMPVGTQATVKGMRFDQLKDKFSIILANTYHLLLRPGLEILKVFGGVHKFSNWPNALLTDSGGFQVMSLQALRKITNEGVMFNSHIDGKKYFLTPESVTEAQYIFGSDISMIFDECTPHPISYFDAEKSMELSLSWAERSRKAYKKRELYKQFGIVQGADYKDLRIRSADALNDMGFEGYAIGGVVGNQAQIMNVLDYTVPLLPEGKPHYLMGVGKP
ncbi:MAG: tRNA guanosine(34) transglycosylase Tgt, partial [Pseudomonadota bacterium]